MDFPYHRSIVPNVAMLLGLAILETVVVHIVAVALWGWTVALILSAIDLSMVVALLHLLRSIRRYPVTIADGVLTMRLGRLKIIPVPLDQIAGLRPTWDAAALKQPGVANLAIGAWPNIVIDLKAPVIVRGRAISTVAHRLDDAPALVAALNRTS